MQDTGGITHAFFEQLGIEPRPRVIGSGRGTIRFDFEVDGRLEHYRVAFARDTIAVDSSAEAADCVVRTTLPVFDRIAGGHLNALPAVLRGLMVVEGDLGLIIRFQRLFPAAEGRAVPTSARTVGRQRS